MSIWTTQKLQKSEKTKNNWGSAFPDIITGFGFRNAVDGCSRAQSSSDSYPLAQATTAQLVHSQPAKASESKSGPCLAHLPPRAAPAAALVTDAAAPKQSIPAPQKAAMLQGAA